MMRSPTALIGGAAVAVALWAAAPALAQQWLVQVPLATPMASRQVVPICPLATLAPPRMEGVAQRVVVGQPRPCPPGPDRTAFTVTTSFGDGVTADTPFVADDALWFIGGVHTYRRAGDYDLVGTMTDRTTGLTTVLRRTIRIPNAPLVKRAAARPSFSTKRTVKRVVARYRDMNPLAIAADHRATVRWGDGTRARGVITKAADGVFTVKARHRYKTAATRTIVVVVADDRGGNLRVRVKPRLR